MALVTLTLATALGAFGSGRAGGHDARALSRRVVLQFSHVAASVTGLALLLVHGAAIALDPQSGVGASATVIPMASGYRPLAVTLGVLAMYTLAFVALIGSARGRLSASARAARVWRLVHALAYVGWAAAMAHGLLAGTDSSLPLVQLLYLGCGALVTAAVAARLSSQNSHDGSVLSQARQSVRASMSRGSR
jgi:hypothetical protein